MKYTWDFWLGIVIIVVAIAQLLLQHFGTAIILFVIGCGFLTNWYYKRSIEKYKKTGTYE